MRLLRLLKSCWIIGFKNARTLRRRLSRRGAENALRNILPDDGALPRQLPMMVREGRVDMAFRVILRHIEVLSEKGRKDCCKHFAIYCFGKTWREVVETVKKGD